MTDQPVRNPEVSIPLDSNHPKVPQLIDSVIILAIEAQNAFIDKYADYGQWAVDLSIPTFTYTGPDREAVFTPYFIGSTSGQSDTWMWGWNNINNFPEGVVEIAEEVYNFGAHFSEPLLTEATQPLAEDARREAGLPEADHGFGIERTFMHVAQALSGIAAPVWYRGPSGPNSYAWFLLSNPAEFSLPEASVLTTVSALTEALQSGYVSDAGMALEGYASKREGVTLDIDDTQAVLHTPGGDVNVDLDDQGRIARIHGTAGPAGAGPAGAPADEQPGTPPAPEKPKGFLAKLFGR